MATGNRKDVELALRVSTLGAEGIGRLEKDIRALAAEGGDAAPRFQQLADEVARLGQQAKALDEFSQLAREVHALSDAQNIAAETSQVLYGELQRLQAATAQFEQAEVAAKNAVKAAQSDLVASKDAVRLLRIETDAAGKTTDEYRTRLQELRLAQLKSEQQIRALKEAYDAAKAATKEAATNEAELQRRMSASNRESERGALVLRERNDALREAKGELAASGVATDDLTSAQRRLVDALNAAGTAANEQVATQKRLIAETRAQALEEERLAGIVLRTRNAMADAAKAEADGIIRDFERMQAAERQAAQAALDAARTISNAFGTIGAKSVRELEAEIDKVRAAMRTLQTTAGVSGAEVSRAMAQGNARIKTLERDIRAATGQLTLMDRAAMGLKSTLGQFAAAFGLVEITQRLGTAFFDANKQIESLRLGLGTIYKSSEIAGKQIDFLRSVADRAGVTVGAISQSFVKFAASMGAANIPIAQSNELFRAVTQAAGTLGLSGDKVSHILDALGQMAAKGNVSMEELRQQLGDSLPGALSLTAKGLGITEQQLVKLVESGGLLARDLFPALTSSLRSMGGEVDTLSSGWERFKNVLTQSSQTAGDSGWTDVLKAGLTTLTVAVGVVIVPLSALMELIFGVAKAAGVLIGAIATLSNPLEALKGIVDDAARRQANLSDAFDRATGAALGNAQAQGTNTQATRAAGQAAAGASLGVQTHTQALDGNRAASGAATAAQTTFGAAAEQAAARATLAAVSIVQLGVQYAETSKRLEVATQVTERMAKAREIEMGALADIVKMRGNERAELENGVRAAESMLTVQRNVLAAREAEMAALRTYLVQLQEEVRLRGDPDGARRREIEERQKKLDLLDAETAKTRETVRANETALATAKLTSQSYEDNAAAVATYKAAVDATTQALREVQVLEINGKATREQVIDATRRAAEAEGLYRDALRDTAAASERAIQQIQNRNLIQQAALNLDAERQRSLAALAKATGDNTLATQAEISGIEIEIKSRARNAQAMAEEVRQRLASIESQRAAQVALNTWNAEKEAEYQKTRAGLDAKKLESEALKESTESLKRQAEALRNGQQAQDTYRGTVNGTTDAINKQNAALRELYDRNRLLHDQSLTNDGFKKNADGSAGGTFNNMLPVEQAFRLANGQIADLEEAKAAFRQAENAFRDMEAFTKLNPGASSPEYQRSTRELFTKARAEMEKLQAPAVGGVRGPTPAAGGGTGSAAGNRTVTVNIGGSATTIGVRSQADSDAVVGLLRQIESASARAA